MILIGQWLRLLREKWKSILFLPISRIRDFLPYTWKHTWFSTLHTLREGGNHELPKLSWIKAVKRVSVTLSLVSCVLSCCNVFCISCDMNSLLKWPHVGPGSCGIGPAAFPARTCYGATKPGFIVLCSAPQIRSTILALYKLVCMYVCMCLYFCIPDECLLLLC